MSREIVSPSPRRMGSTKNPFHNAERESQHNIKSSKQERMSSSSSFRSAKSRARDTSSTIKRALPSSSTCSPQAKCQFCEFIETSHWESGSADLSVPQNSAACVLCASEPPHPRYHPSPSERRKAPQLPVCVDPECSDNICEDCPDSICEECSNPEGSCEDCVGQCVSDCKDSICGDGPDSIVHYDYPYDTSNPELFGDQAAQMFNFDGRIPQLQSDTAPLQFGGPGTYIGDVKAPLFTGLGAFENAFGSYDKFEPSSVPMPFHMQHKATEANLPSCLENSGTLDAPEFALNERLTTSNVVGGSVTTQARISSHAPNRKPQYNDQSHNHTSLAAPQLHPLSLGTSRQMVEHKGVLIAPAESTPPQDSNLRSMISSPNQHARPSTQCQWAGPDGQACGMAFELGTDLHEHLKTAHEVKSEVFCRWIGCRFGTLGSTPHRYANSVERHTWGHSGYRPYKCSVCAEGFAAANVRDEHFNNFHLKRKMFSCDMCSHECTSARNLKRHKDDTHTTERFQCEFCNRHGKIRLFPRASNLARHFRKCKVVLALFPDAAGAATGKIDDNWFPTGYRGGHQGMDKAKVTPPNYLPVTK